MLLLLLDSFLLIFIAFSTGSIARNMISHFLGLSLRSVFIEDFILGLVFCSVYFNLLSFILPVNYLALLPLLGLSIGWQWKKREWSLRRFGDFFHTDFRETSGLILATLLVALVIIYLLVPPINHDSADYHYQAVYWNETQKIIPGLGNVHGRLAFNAATFMLSAPFSFSHPVGQSLYPLNGVLVLLFYVWLLQNIIRRKNNWSALAYLVTAIFLFRPLLANIPSPASEPLAIITVAFVIFRLAELIQEKHHKDPAYLVIPFLICFFAVTAKLTSLPLLIIPVAWIFFYISRRSLIFYLKLVAIIIIIMVPWLARNIVLSGYLVYPLYQLDLFNVDWKVPRDVAIFDYALGTYGSKGAIDGGLLLQQHSFEWFIPWLKNHLQQKKIIDLVVFILCFTSPVTWLMVFIKKKINKPLFILWLCVFAGSVVWLVRAPEYRFGMGFLLLSFCIPMINALTDVPLSRKLFRFAGCSLFFIAFCYYTIRAVVIHPRMHTHGIGMLWLKPMKDQRYYKPVDMNTFRYEDLGNGVKLYLKDLQHDCIHIKDQPCMLWYYGKIAMRGNKLSDGFRSVKDETRKTYPWMFTRQW